MPKEICSNCETGKKSYQLDPQASCPYLYLCNGKKCAMHIAINKNNAKKVLLIEKIFSYFKK